MSRVTDALEGVFDLVGQRAAEELADELATEIYEEWLAALTHVYHLAKGERLGELRGKRSKFLDDRGVHVLSEAWGRVQACESLLPALAAARLSDPFVDLVQLRRIAQRDAERAFYDELVAGGPDPGQAFV